MRKRVLCVILALVMMFAFASAAMAADTAKSTPKAGSFIIQVDGRTLSSDVAPMIKNGRTLAPIRVISEALGMKVDYEDRLVIIRSYDGHKTLELPIDFKEATVYIDGKVSDVLKMDVPAQIKNGRTLVPLRLVAEFFEADVQYVPGSWKTVKITTPAVSVNGQELNSMTMHTYMTMGGWIMGYWGNNIVGEMYNRLIAGIGEETEEPAVYGRHGLIDYKYAYYLSEQVSFYNGNPVVNYDEGQEEPGVRNFILYIRTSGYSADVMPDDEKWMGTDHGPYLIYDCDADKWYELSKEAFYNYNNIPKSDDMVEELLNNVV